MKHFLYLRMEYKELGITKTLFFFGKKKKKLQCSNARIDL